MNPQITWAFIDEVLDQVFTFIIILGVGVNALLLSFLWARVSVILSRMDHVYPPGSRLCEIEERLDKVTADVLTLKK